MELVNESEIIRNRWDEGADWLRGCLEGSVELPEVQWCILRWNCGVSVHESDCL